MLVSVISSTMSIGLARDYAAAGPCTVKQLNGIWLDSARADRPVPYRIYYPQDGKAPYPLVIFSHGLGGNCLGYEYFGRHLASHGYVAVHITHRGSDTQMLRESMGGGLRPMEAMRKSAANPENLSNRPKDVSFAIDQLTGEGTCPAELRGQLDLAHIAVAGHSFGGYTAMAAAGQGIGALNLRDDRVIAAIAMSAPAPKLPGAYSKVSIPVMMMTGTLDNSPLTGGSMVGRERGFEQLQRADRYLLIFEGGDHMVFAGGGGKLAELMPGVPGTAGDRNKDAAIMAQIKALSLAFLDTYVRDGADAARWLKAPEGAKAALTSIAEFEFKAK